MKDNELIELLVTNGFEIQNQSNMYEIVSQQIQYLLEHDLNRLYGLLYRIDVSEHKSKAAFGGTTETIAQNLTQLIIERLQQKIESRKKY